MSAIVVYVNAIEKHPNADRLDVLKVSWPSADGLRKKTLVTGQHYQEKTFGVYVAAGAFIPGYLVEECWLGGREKTMNWFQIVEKTMRGIASPGIFLGAIWRETVKHDFKPWPLYRDWWEIGQDVAAYLGIRDDVPTGCVSTYASKR